MPDSTKASVRCADWRYCGRLEMHRFASICLIFTNVKDVGLDFIEQVFGASVDDSEGGHAQRFLSKAEKFMEIRCQTVCIYFQTKRFSTEGLRGEAIKARSFKALACFHLRQDRGDIRADDKKRRER